MKPSKIHILAGKAEALERQGWITTNEAITAAILAMKWPPGASNFRIPRMKRFIQKRKRVEWRNGVEPMKTMFRGLMREKRWLDEESLSFSQYFAMQRETYPKGSDQNNATEVLNQSVGNFDFAITDETG